MRRVGICVHPRWQAAHELGRRLQEFLQGKVEEVWLATAWDDAASRLIPGTDLLVCIGGDGTMLWAARAMVPHRIPMVGVGMGRLAFLAEVEAEEAPRRLEQALKGEGRLEDRWLLQAQTSTRPTAYGLNDVVVGRATMGRPIYVEVALDGQVVALFRADAVIVATATGSTAYSLSAGGPILPAQSRDLVLTPVAPHMALSRSLILPPNTYARLTVRGEQGAYYSIDGQQEEPLTPGEWLEVRISPYAVPFLRLSPPWRDYLVLARRLGWTLGDPVPQQGEGPTTLWEAEHGLQ